VRRCRPNTQSAHVATGAVEIDHCVHGVGRMLVLAPGEPVAITGVEKAIVLLLGGEPVGERFVEWNFVSSSRERIAQAKADWRAGRLKLPDLDDREWIPLPSDPPPAAEPMS
jgi:hypothetical protein